jgi:L-asparaginase/Glu-tRNA(Gln) amidotransferase subunit D
VKSRLTALQHLLQGFFEEAYRQQLHLTAVVSTGGTDANLSGQSTGVGPTSAAEQMAVTVSDVLSEDALGLWQHSTVSLCINLAAASRQLLSG